MPNDDATVPLPWHQCVVFDDSGLEFRQLALRLCFDTGHITGSPFGVGLGRRLGHSGIVGGGTIGAIAGAIGSRARVRPGRLAVTRLRSRVGPGSGRECAQNKLSVALGLDLLRKLSVGERPASWPFVAAWTRQ